MTHIDVCVCDISSDMLVDDVLSSRMLYGDERGGIGTLERTWMNCIGTCLTLLDTKFGHI